MNDLRPYLIRALYKWIEDNKLTPHIAIDNTKRDIVLPKFYAKQDSVVFNISKPVAEHLIIGDKYIEFSGVFYDEPHRIRMPISAINGIYAHENNQGMWFNHKSIPSKSKNKRNPHLTLSE